MRSGGHGDLGGTTLPAAVAAREQHPFVGRDRELAVLAQRLAVAATGRPQLVALGGEPGVGKTRLARRFARQAHDDGAVVLFGRCDEDPLERYQPFVEALRDRLTSAGRDTYTRLPTDAGLLGRLLPELRAQLPPVPELVAVDAETERFRLFEAVTNALRSTGGGAPVVFVLDDLHWADQPTLLLLRHVLRTASPLPVLVVATYRDTDIGRGHPLSDLLADLRRDEGLTHRVAVDGLDDDAVLALLERLAGHELPAATRDLARELRRITGGNAFFIREIVAHFVEIGALQRNEDGRWEVVDLDDVGGIPDGVREVVLRRVGRLSSEAQRALVHASVVGRDFDVALLATVVDIDETELVELLDEALAARLLVETAGAVDRLAFAHAIVRETLYSTVSLSRRVRLHRAVGEALEARTDGRRQLADLARHFAHAPDEEARAKALVYAREAGDEAMAMLAYENAASAYANAVRILDQLDRGDDDARLSLLLLLGNAHIMASQRDGARRAYRDAAEVARRVRSADALTDAALGFAGMFGNPGEPDPETCRLLEEALAIETEPTARAELLTRLGNELIHSPDAHRRALEIFDEAVQSASAVPATPALVTARWYRRLLAARPFDPAERVALAQDTRALAESLDDPTARLAAYGWLLIDHLEAGAIGDARHDIDAYGALVQQERMPYRRGFPRLWRGTLALLEGRLDDAEVLSQEALAAAAEGDTDVDPMFFTNWSGQLFALRLLEGRAAELREAIEMVVAAKPGLLAWRAALAVLCAETGDHERAAELYRELTSPSLSTLPVDGLWPFTMCLLAEVALHLDDRARFDEFEALLRPWADRHVVVAYAAFSYGPVALRLGALAIGRGDLDQAERDLRQALDASRSMGAWPWVATVELAMAELAAQRGDAARARSLRTSVMAAAKANAWGGLTRPTAAAPVPRRRAPVSPW